MKEAPAEELDRFKREIDLRAYAESLGYELDKADSWKGAFVMRRGDDKIKISLNSDGHWVYFSYRDSADNGTIIDFAQRRRGCSLGVLRKELREWAGEPWNPSPAETRLVEPVAKDIGKVRRAWNVMAPVPPHPYLEQQRKIPAGVLLSDRFRGCVRMARNGVAAFRHFDAEGLCGLEFKGPDVTRFIAGGRKGLWFSNRFAGDDALLIFESALEALSHAALFPDERIRYVSTGGYISDRQRSLIAAAIRDMPAESDIVASMNRDEGGQRLAGIVREVFRETGLTDRRFVSNYPRNFNDWNDLLKAERSKEVYESTLQNGNTIRPDHL